MMKTTNYLLTIIFLMLLSVSQAQEKFKISAYTGANKTVGDFKELTKPGFDVGITFDYAFSKKFKLGFDVNHQINDFINPIDFGKIPENDFYSITNLENGNWKTTTIGFGSTYTFGNKNFFVDLYSKAGISLTQSPTILTTIDFNGIESEIFRLDSQSLTSFGITSGLRFNYSLSKNLSIFINPQYVYSSAKIKYNFRDINASFIDDEFNPGLLVEQPLEVKEVTPSYLNLNLGLTLKLGGKKKKSNLIEENDLDTNCLKTILQSPNNNERYLVSSKVQPVFSWLNHSNTVKNHEFILYEKGKVIFSKKTKSNTLEINKKLKRILNNKTVKEKIFEWQVKTTFENCPDQYSNKQSFSVRASNSIEINITDIECLTPAYDANGNVRYKAKVEFKTGNNSSQWNISSLSLIESGNQIIPINSLNSCTSPFAISPMSPLVLAPNSSSIWCFEFSVPVGSLNQTFQANGTLGNGSGDVSVLKNLPSCICNVCDSKQIIPSNVNFWKFNYNGGLSNMRVGTSFQILNSDPIQKVKAEIVSVQHKVNDTLCYSCTKDANTMGLFHKSNSSGLIISKNGWQNNGRGELSDENNDNYGNSFTWKAATTQGIDFSTSKRFLMNMNLPPISALDCCETTYKVCIRYTFEDINCQTCDYLVCYQFDSSKTSTGGGIGTSVGTGVGNQSGGVLTLSNPLSFVGKKHNELLNNALESNVGDDIENLYNNFDVSKSKSFKIFDSEIEQLVNKPFNKFKSNQFKKYGESLEKIFSYMKENGINDSFYKQIDKLQEKIIKTEKLVYNYKTQKGNEVAQILGVSSIFKHSALFWSNRKVGKSKSIFGKIWRDTKAFVSSGCHDGYEFDLKCATDAAAAASATTKKNK